MIFKAVGVKEQPNKDECDRVEKPKPFGVSASCHAFAFQSAKGIVQPAFDHPGVKQRDLDEYIDIHIPPQHLPDTCLYAVTPAFWIVRNADFCPPWKVERPHDVDGFKA